MERDNGSTKSSYLVLFAPVILTIIFILDTVIQLVTTHTYVPHEWLLSILSGTISASLAQYFQKDYVRRLEADRQEMLLKLECNGEGRDKGISGQASEEAGPRRP